MMNSYLKYLEVYEEADISCFYDVYLDQNPFRVNLSPISFNSWYSPPSNSSSSNFFPDNWFTFLFCFRENRCTDSVVSWSKPRTVGDVS
jgi:hypothetical protein